MAERIAIVGAGIAGAACARYLLEAGREVSAFDKGRGAGGRTSTRRTDHGRFDHGAQYFTARSERFQAQVDDWLTAGAAAPWHGRFCKLDPATGDLMAAPEGVRYVGTPGMNALVKDLLVPVDTRFGARVVGIERAADAFTLTFADGTTTGGFGRIVVATPAPQAVPLLSAVAPSLAAAVDGIAHSPCWAVMASFSGDIQLAGDGIKVAGGPLDWLARDSAKPQRTAGSRWVLHATPAWSIEHLEREPSDVAARLLAALQDLVGDDLPSVHHIAAHRWRFARPSAPHLGSTYLLETGVGVCGDGFGAGRVEAAWTSGRDLASALVAELG